MLCCCVSGVVRPSLDIATYVEFICLIVGPPPYIRCDKEIQGAGGSWGCGQPAHRYARCRGPSSEQPSAPANLRASGTGVQSEPGQGNFVRDHYGGEGAGLIDGLEAGAEDGEDDDFCGEDCSVQPEGGDERRRARGLGRSLRRRVRPAHC